ncbi:MAG: autotransporter strand-loop-strand O-heptosyltransferase [Selenomonadaceae bacterium]|nr:autotransporter strand-loop-strand O-heptosyltransferase [Selenomonadaceae bacterium]
MRKIFFCARELDDYLSKVKNIDKLALPAAKSFDPTLLDLPLVQEILSSVANDSDDEKFFGTPPENFLQVDFNSGLRLQVPHGNFHVVISDFSTGKIFFDRDLSDTRLISVEKYFIRWHVEIFLDGRKIFQHTFNPEGRTILIIFDKHGGLGDTLANLPYAREFAKIFNCRVLINLPEHMRELAANFYPDLEQVDEAPPELYAAYRLKMNFGDFPIVPADLRSAPLNRVAGAILGLTSLPSKPTFTPTAPKIFSEPYVCIAVQASSAIKGWHWPGGWKIVVDYLKSLGYRVLCIDREKIQRAENYVAHMPEGAEDFTGNLPLIDRANMLYHAEFFIGLSSGLAWLADYVSCPVVMICGFSLDWHEFYTPYRVANRLVCNGCYCDLRVRAFDNFCPYQKSTPRELECQRKISALQVLETIERLILDRGLTPPALDFREC